MKRELIVFIPYETTDIISIFKEIDRKANKDDDIVFMKQIKEGDFLYDYDVASSFLDFQNGDFEND